MYPERIMDNLSMEDLCDLICPAPPVDDENCDGNHEDAQENLQ